MHRLANGTSQLVVRHTTSSITAILLDLKLEALKSQYSVSLEVLK
ncbi:MAG: hypothetical protein ACKERG_04150 [Candidatus Hodgkinia cicadicola]